MREPPATYSSLITPGNERCFDPLRSRRIGEAKKPGPLDMFADIDEALEAEEWLPPLDESSDDEDPMLPPDDEEEDDTDDDTNGFVFEYRGPRN